METLSLFTENFGGEMRQTPRQPFLTHHSLFRDEASRPKDPNKVAAKKKRKKAKAARRANRR